MDNAKVTLYLTLAIGSILGENMGENMFLRKLKTKVDPIIKTA